MSEIRRINCENCNAPYNINVATLKKERNTVTCRRCKHKIIVYKSGFSEPNNEQARVSQDDEKTLVDETPEPKAQTNIPVMETEISSKPPPLSVNLPVQDTQEQEDRFDRTARSKEFNSLYEQGQALKADPTLPRPRTQKKANPFSPKEEKKLETAPRGSESKSKKSVSNGAIQQMLFVVSGLLLVGAFSSLGIFFFAPEIPAKVLLLVNVSSLTLALSMIATGYFGALPSKMGMSAGISALCTALVAVGLFGGMQSETEEVQTEEKEFVAPPEPVVKSIEEEEEEAPVVDVDKSTNRANRRVATKNTPKGSYDNDTSKAIGTLKSASKYEDEPEIEEPEEVVAVVDPIEEDLGEDDFDMPVDLDLDAEPEEKRGLLGRRSKKEEPKPAPKPAPKAKPAPKVNISQSVLDIIIRNNQDAKGCYIAHRREYNELPKNVEVLFTLQPSGRVSQAYIADGPYVGSKFEACLRAAFKGMNFPEFDSNAKPQSLRYTFKI